LFLYGAYLVASATFSSFMLVGIAVFSCFFPCGLSALGYSCCLVGGFVHPLFHLLSVVRLHFIFSGDVIYNFSLQS
jgi:hypothetical protein